MLDFKKIEKDVLEKWEKNKTYQKVKEKNKDGKKFYFLQGPPYTSGKIHIGHAWNNALKDIAMRYKRMNGFNVWDRGGYDMHGLPTENAVQKKLGLKTKEAIEKYGVEKFVRECYDFADEHARYMNVDLWKLGVWMDHEGAYKPIEKEFIGGEWMFFKKAFEQGRLYKGKKVMHWDAETETSLAKHELEYKTVTDTSVFLKFKRKDEKNEYFVIWTTTPWTIPFNLGIMVNPELKYVKARVDDEIWIIAKDLANVFISGFMGKNLDIIDEINGSEMEGWEYEHFFQNELINVYDKLKKESKNMHSVLLSAKYVDTSAGTGLVHCAPGCGPEDNEVGDEYGIFPLNTLNERGEFEEMGKFTGWKAKEDDDKFIKEFEKKGALLGTSHVEHEYPHSWRSHKPVIFRTTEQWFLKIEDLVQKILEFNKKVHWEPKKSGDAFERWTENLKDNSVTRQRYWGCPLPIWVNTENQKFSASSTTKSSPTLTSGEKVDDIDDVIVIGSVEELEELTGKKFDDLSLHRPWIDEIVLEKNGKKYKRIPDVADVWIDSGTASWNCLYNQPELIKKWYPADLVLEGTEHTRLWFNMLQICASIAMNGSSFKNAYAHGMILDYQGTKMSKSLGNVISPYEVIDKYSVDILRNYICEVTAGENINFSWEDIKVKQRNLVILGNIANYLLDLKKQGVEGVGELGIEDKWILSRFNSTLKKVTELFDSYRLDETIAEIERLYITLSRDYIKFVRDKASSDRVVLETAKEVYLGVLKIFSTVCPFVCEHLWEKMKQSEESIHMCEWPKFDESKIDLELERKFDLVKNVIEKGLALRDKEGMGLKWPLSKAVITMSEEINPEMIEIIMIQLNVKKIELKNKKGNQIEVELDFVLTNELKAEGFAREIARRVQAERKIVGLEKKDRINLQLCVSSELREDLKVHLEYIKERTGSRMINVVDKIDNEKVMFKIKNQEVKFAFS